MEIPITSAFDFLRIAHDLKKNRKHSSAIDFYRGQPDREYILLPTIYRSGMLDFEEELIDEFIRRRPDEFSENDGLFNIIAKMQHYGLHTRLLDVTENPVVSLYFTCCENFDKDGEIFIFQRSLDEIPNNTVLNIIVEFYVRHKSIGGNYDVSNYYNYVVKKYKAKDVEMAFYHIVNGYYCFARPKLINERILRQSGSFMLFTNDVCPSGNCKDEKCIHRGTDKCNISGDIREKVKAVSIEETFRDYTDYHVANEQNGYRYIVKAENKKDILSELQTIGINKAFLFPELNNDGIDIMNYYARFK